jgi:hypothetical protein
VAIVLTLSRYVQHCVQMSGYAAAKMRPFTLKTTWPGAWGNPNSSKDSQYLFTSEDG